MGWLSLAVCLTGDCDSALLSGSGGFVAGFGSDAVAGKMVVCSVTYCFLRFSELFTLFLVGEATPLKDIAGKLLSKGS